MTASKLTVVLLTVFGSLLALVGLVLGFAPHTAGIGVDCGSAFAPDQTVWFQGCVEATSDARTLALALLVPGLIALATAGFYSLYRWQMAREAADVTIPQGSSTVR